MDRIDYSVHEAPGLWPGTRVYRIACRHGVSSAAMIPGAKPLADATVVDLMVPGHQRTHGCACELEGRGEAVLPATAAAVTPAAVIA